MLDAVRGPLPSALVRGVYLYGSAVVGGLRPDSNLDVLAVVDRALTASERRALVEGLVPISSRALRPDAWRPVELTVVVRGAIEPWRYPPAREIQYGEWVRDELIADPDTAGPVRAPTSRSCSRGCGPTRACCTATRRPERSPPCPPRISGARFATTCPGCRRR